MLDQEQQILLFWDVLLLWHCGQRIWKIGQLAGIHEFVFV